MIRISRTILRTEEEEQFLEELFKIDKEDLVNGLSDFLQIESLGADDTKLKFISNLKRCLIRYPDTPL